MIARATKLDTHTTGILVTLGLIECSGCGDAGAIGRRSRLTMQGQGKIVDVRDDQGHDMIQSCDGKMFHH